MGDRPKKFLSYAAAAVLAVITLAVFSVLQNFGPESTARRFNALGETLQYIPMTAHYTPGKQVHEVDKLALTDLTVAGPEDPYLRLLLDLEVRPAGFSNAAFEIVRLDYKTTTQAIAVIKYTYPGCNQQFFVWILELERGAWRINAKKTYDTVANMIAKGDTN
ncbi:hypothetical protein BH11ARM1_BH11ARM1_10170 [soil metagenome]